MNFRQVSSLPFNVSRSSIRILSIKNDGCFKLKDWRTFFEFGEIVFPESDPT